MSEPRLRVFVWRDVLRDYTAGMVVVVAGDVGEARALAMCECNYMPPGELAAEPEVIGAEQLAIVLWGGG